VIDDLPTDGRLVIIAAWVGTAAFVLTSVASVITTSMRAAGVAVALVLFGAGIVAFLGAYARAIERSRTEEIGIGGLYFLAGSAPKAVRWHMMGAATVQTVVALAAAAARPFTAVAFGILVPMYGLGMAGLWASRYGTFPRRRDTRQKKQRTR
jgi:hypothetical protein